MADIELVIKIPEEYYKSIKDDAKKFLSKGMKVPSLYEIVIKGTPLPNLNDALEKIRTEIEKLEYLNIEDGSGGYDKYIEQYEILKIIDEYKAESLDAIQEKKNDDLER